MPDRSDLAELRDAVGVPLLCGALALGAGLGLALSGAPLWLWWPASFLVLACALLALLPGVLRRAEARHAEAPARQTDDPR